MGKDSDLDVVGCLVVHEQTSNSTQKKKKKSHVKELVNYGCNR